ncbi:MAG: DUF5050 domain-containing protein [Planctomycetota bacterium]|jgi:Tol biopolymer transport system component
MKVTRRLVWAIVLVVGIAALLFFFFAPSDNVKSLVKSYNYWSDPGLYQRQDRPGKFFSSTKRLSQELTKLLSSECKVILQYPDGEITSATRGEFLEGLNKLRFMFLVEQVLIDGPIIEPRKGRFLVKMTKGFRQGNVIEIAECELVVEKSVGNLLISEIKRTYREPTEDDINEVRGIAKDSKGEFKREKNRPYNPKKGLGSRYLGGGTFAFTHPSFSPDSTKIVFSSLRHESAEIYIADCDGSNLTRLTDTPYWEVAPSFTPDGENIIFLSDKDNYAGEPYLIDIDGYNYRRFLTYSGTSNVRYSPTGTHVAFTVQKGKAKEVFVMKSDGTGVKQLTESGRKNSALVFSPNGQKLYFLQSWLDRRKEWPLCQEICSVNTNGSDLRQLTSDEERKTPLAATVDYLVFEREQVEENHFDDVRELWLIKPDGSSQQCIMGGNANDASYTGVRLLPDYNHIAFTDDRQTPYVYNIYIKELFGSKGLRRLTHGDCCRSTLGVSADGRYIVYVSEQKGRANQGKGNIRIVSIDGSEAWTVCKSY